MIERTHFYIDLEQLNPKFQATMFVAKQSWDVGK